MEPRGKGIRPDKEVRTLRTRRSEPLSRWCSSLVHTASRYVLCGRLGREREVQRARHGGLSVRTRWRRC